MTQAKKQTGKFQYRKAEYSVSVLLTLKKKIEMTVSIMQYNNSTTNNILQSDNQQTSRLKLETN